MKPKDYLDNNCIRTFNGVAVDLLNPTVDMILIDDIAHSLAMQVRFAGHISHFYSVAQHSVKCATGVDKQHKLAALLHDASEAYLVDVPSPVKKNLIHYKPIEENFLRVIAKKFGFEYPFAPEVKQIDSDMLHLEFYYLMEIKKPHFECWSPQKAKVEFLEYFRQLTNEK